MTNRLKSANRRERRSKLEIYSVILNSIIQEKINSNTVRPTRIQFRSGLSYDNLKKYLDKLREKGFMQNSKEIVVTRKGKRFLKEYEKIRLAVKQIGLKY